MPNLRIDQETRSGNVTLRLEGIFDPDAARALAEAISKVRAKIVQLDFSRVRTFLDLAIPILTRAVPAERLRVLGLARQHEQVFRCFGVRAGGAPEAEGRESAAP